MPVSLMVLLSLVTAITGTFVLRVAMRAVSGKSPGLKYLLMFFVASFAAQYIILTAFIPAPAS